MAIDLKKVSKGPIAAAPRVLVYSADGVGKTRFASGAPDPLFIDVNKGSLDYNVRRVLPESWPEVMEWLAAVENGQVQCETLVIDSITDLENMLHAHLFQGTTIDEYKGGYKRGDTYALTHWRELLMQLERIWFKGKGIVLVAHMVVRKFEDPTGPGYERFEVAARPQVAGLLRQWVSYVLFAREDVHMQSVGKGNEAKQKATTTNLRKIYTRRMPAYDAKSRGTTLFPDSLPLSWDDFFGAIKADAARVVELRKEIDELLTELGDASMTKAMNDWIGSKPERLVEARNRVAAKLAEKREKSTHAESQPAAAASV
jgi:hypothetical protein